MIFDDDKVMTVSGHWSGWEGEKVRRWCWQHSSAQDIQAGARVEEIEMPEMRKISSTSLVTKLLSRAFLIKPPQPPAVAAENLNDNFFWKLFSSGTGNLAERTGDCYQYWWDDVVMSNNKDNDDICGLIRKSLQSMTPISVYIGRPSINFLNKWELTKHILVIEQIRLRVLERLSTWPSP